MLNFLISKPVYALLFTCLFAFQRLIKAQDYNITFCDDPSNFTSNTQFETNLMLLFSSLIPNLPPSGFYNTTSGQRPDQVYGLVQCRGDVSNQACSSCVNTSAVEIIRYCPNRKKAAIRHDNCLLRYSDERFFSVIEIGEWDYDWTGDNVSNPDLFYDQLATLLRNLSSAAAFDPSKFRTDVSRFTNFINIYGLVQCTRDLSDGDCRSCLEYLITQIPSCCYSKPGARLQSPSCNIRYETYPFFQTSPPQPRSASPGLNDGSSDGNGDSSRTLLVILIPVLVILALISTISTYLLWRKKLKKAADSRNGGDIANADSLLFDLDTIRTATNNFSNGNKLGEGGFGPVYKGQLLDGQEIAVKRLSVSSAQGLEELKNEVALVAKLQHRNLVRLLGCCLQEREKLLVYEYVPNTSLNKFLFDPVRRLTLDWGRRYKIIGGIARGILYLHEDSQLRIVHRDLKASNILLDGEMNPKISDFGLARLFGRDQTQDNTSRIAGTFGYMAPEYVMHGQYSRKSDVYSFGVLVLEIVTGKKNTDFEASEYATDLLSYTWWHWTQGTALELLDQSVGEQCPQNEVLRCIHIGLLCVQEDAAVRPTMSSVVLMLNSFVLTFPSPSAPGFLVRAGRAAGPDVLMRDINLILTSNSDQSKSESRALTLNEVSISDLDPR